MTSPADLLPQNSDAAPFEKALATAMGDSLPAPIGQAVDPAQTPAAFLPFLAVHEGVRLWFADWAEATKRRVIAESIVANFEVGARAASARFLSYVDATIVATIAYPARFIVGASAVGRAPIAHPDFTARYLVKIVTHKRGRALIVGRSPIGRRPLLNPSRDPFARALAALRAAKAPESWYRVDFAHKRKLTFGDAPLLDGARRFGDFVDRKRF